MTRQRRRIASILAFGILAAACGSDDPTSAPTPGGTSGGEEESESSGDPAGSPSALTLTADNIAFDTDRIEVGAGEEITVTFENLEDGIQHNFHVQAGDVDVATDIAPGPDTQDLTFTVEEPGDYTFICDVHPDQMIGDLVVS